MTYDPELLSAVSALDKDMPGWHRKINLDSFDMFSCTRCVIGQVFPPIDQSPVDNFDHHRLRLHNLGYIGGNAFALFENQWRHLISTRQTADQFTYDSLAVEERVDMIEGVAV